MKDNLQLIGQVILIALGPLLAKHGVSVGNAEIDDILGAISEIAGIVWKFRHWNATPAASAAPQTIAPKLPTSSSGFARPIVLFYLSAICFALAAIVIVGCAPLQPGADPIVVNVERAQTIAASTFDLVLNTDNSERAFWQQKAPAFHDFCEWLRAPQTAFLADGTPTNVQRVIALQLNLDKVKLDYKASRASSNDVFSALATLNSAIQQADAWMMVVTNSPQSAAGVSPTVPVNRTVINAPSVPMELIPESVNSADH